MAQSTKNVFKALHDLDLLDLVGNKNPYMAECQSAAWDEMVKALNDAKLFPKPVNKRAVQSRVNILVKAYRTDDLQNKVKSGTEEQYGQIKALVIRISSAIDDSNKARIDKTKAVAAKIIESDSASQAVMEEGEKGRSKRPLDSDTSELTDEEAEKQEFVHTTGGSNDDWEDEKEYRKA
ncbi:hypothetical protein RvY_05628 [Ramazzottius varieornatus]|uniref:Uncharacterized protein n=1 Tax=Ramazzottius varieornatus TaxID=947166 RepID=A0A1D1UVN8_RAMVA|nr:hypothetical protein RvY_05628 [Ramazzottius varieornatus]